jgi:MFS family permease
MMSYVAIPFQLYELTKSSFLVGLLGFTQLAPLVIAGLWGGALADSMDRRRLLIGSEALLVFVTLLLLLNSLLAEPSVVVLFLASTLSSVLIGFHRPAMEALTPQLVDEKEMAAVAALSTMRHGVGAVAGPALGGLLIANWGIEWTYAVDAATYVFSLVALAQIKSIPVANAEERADWKSIREGFSYAMGRPVLVGSYLVDIIAMVFAMPMALYPALSLAWGGASAAGWLYAALPMGALVISLLSRPLTDTSRHGAGVVIGATIWGVFIVVLAFQGNLLGAVICLALAGAADGASGIFRQTIWNQTIPANFRGRLAGLNMLSYMIGPLLGNARAGFMASFTSNFSAIFLGGCLCVIGSIAAIRLFPEFWRYQAK